MSVPETSNATPTKLALLIGCSYPNQNLPGTEHDVEAIAEMLQRFGFVGKNNVKILCGLAATRENILAELKVLLSRLSEPSKTFANVPVVIYYSGHGASTTLDTGPEKGKTVQFLVPSNFDEDQNVFRGILDSEMSRILQAITDKTHNVTYILDCCHSARLGRAPPYRDTVGAVATETWEKAWVSDGKSESNFHPDLITAHIKRLRQDRALLDNDNWSNPLVVRIAAAAADETAWQYKNSMGLHVGIMTEKLVLMLNEASHKSIDEAMSSCDLSWRSIMLGVKAHVELQFGRYKEPQKPRSGGADSRIPFGLTTTESMALLAVVGESRTVLWGGRVHGVGQGDEYILVPFMPEQPVGSLKVTVKSVRGFKASLSAFQGSNSFQQALALPYSRKERWQMSVPKHLDQVHDQLNESKFFTATTTDTSKVRIQQETHSNEIALYGREVCLGSGKLDDPPSIEKLLSTAHTFVRAQELLSFERGQDTEWLDAAMKIELGLVIDEEKNLLALCNSGLLEGTDPPCFTAGDQFYIDLVMPERVIENQGSNPRSSNFYVSVFRVDAAGKITLINEAWESGICMSDNIRRYSLMRDEFEGIPLHWPKSIPRQATIRETFVFVITQREENLRSLETSTSADYIDVRRKAWGDAKASASVANPYNVMRIHYDLRWPEETDSSESMATGRSPLTDITLLPTEAIAAEKGVWGGFTRWLRGTPAYVWVMNKHDEKITVEISTFTTRLVVTGAGVGASPTGAQINLESQPDRIPPTRKQLTPGEVARFPLWTRKEGFGFITIFVGNSETPFISNDQVTPGIQVNFTNKANLELVEYNEGEA